MKAVGYVRVSTATQADGGVSLAMQTEKIRAWAALNDAELVAVHTDEGISAKSSDRPALQVALARAKREGAALIVYSLSRFSRSTRDTLELVAVLERAGCELVSLTERIDTSSAGGRMVFRMMAALAEFEREQLAERTKAAMQHLRAQGRCVGAVPHGYRRRGTDLVADAREQEMVGLVRKLRAKGLTLRQIADDLAGRGVLNREGRKFNPKSVAAILQAA